MSTKKYTSRIVAFDAFGDAILPLPKELIEELDWHVHDELQLNLVNGSIHIKNVSKEKRDKK